MYNNIGLEPIAWRCAPVIWNLAKWNSVKWNETHELGQFLHASASRGFVSVSWAFLYFHASYISCCSLKSVYIYGSYCKIKTRVSLFGPPCISKIRHMISLHKITSQSNLMLLVTSQYSIQC